MSHFKRFKILDKARENIKKNGIQEGLFTIKYELKSTVKEHLFTKFVVFYNKSSILNNDFINKSS